MCNRVVQSLQHMLLDDEKRASVATILKSLSMLDPDAISVAQEEILSHDTFDDGKLTHDIPDEHRMLMPQSGEAQDFMRLVRSVIPSKTEKRNKGMVYSTIERVLKRRWKSCKLFRFGSTGSGFATAGSDMDLCVRIHQGSQPKQGEELRIQKRKWIYAIKGRLESSGLFHDVSAIAHARVPIVKAKHQSGIEVDICINNELAIHNTHLIRLYADIDERFFYLGMWVKLWVKSRCINRADLGTLSSYAWIILVIFFLQQKDILPNLQSAENVVDEERQEVNGYECTFCKSPEKLARMKEYAATKSESLATLIFSFYQFYSNLKY